MTYRPRAADRSRAIVTAQDFGLLSRKALNAAQRAASPHSSLATRELDRDRSDPRRSASPLRRRSHKRSYEAEKEVSFDFPGLGFHSQRRILLPFCLPCLTPSLG